MAETLTTDVGEEVTLEGTSLPLERQFDLLKNARRRYVLEYLRDHHGPVDIGDLTEYVATRETGTSPEDLSSKQRKRAYVGLYQCHLPRMDEVGVVWLDTERGVVAVGAAAPQLYRYLSPRDPPPDRWYRYYLAIVGGASALLLGSAFLVGEGVAAVLGVFVTTLLACAIVHTLSRSGLVGPTDLPLWLLHRSADA